MIGEEIRNHLFELQDEGYREFHKGLVPGEDKIIGIRVPVLRKYAKALMAEEDGDTEKLLSVIGDEYYEEVLLKAILIGFEKDLTQESLKRRIENFVPLIKNWAVCDTFCSGLKTVKKHKKEVWKLINEYLTAEGEFQVRFALVMMIDYYIDDEYLDDILQRASSVRHSGYYAKMAAGWLISICFVKYYDRTFEFMKNNSMDDFIYNMGIRKARESTRLSAKQKEELLSLKKLRCKK